MNTRTLAAAITLALAFTASPSLACSVVADYRVPTNLELVEEADVIVLGRVTGQQVTGDDPWDVALMVEPIEAIRGALPDGPLLLPEMTIAEDEFAILSNPYELQHAHPDSGSGACVRYSFPADTVALFFLDAEGGALRPLRAPFSRWAEDVLTDDAPWLRLVRFYAQVVAAPAAQRDVMLQAEEARYAALAHDPVARLMAADIARQRAGPNRTMDEAMDAEMGAYADAMANAEAAMDASDQVEVTEGADGTSLQGTIRVGPAEGADKPERRR